MIHEKAIKRRRAQSIMEAFHLQYCLMDLNFLNSHLPHVKVSSPRLVRFFFVNARQSNCHKNMMKL